MNRAERNQHVVQMHRVVSEEVPAYPLFYNLSFVAHVANLRGPVMPISNDVMTWNLHERQWLG